MTTVAPDDDRARPVVHRELARIGECGSDIAHLNVREANQHPLVWLCARVPIADVERPGGHRQRSRHGISGRDEHDVRIDAPHPGDIKLLLYGPSHGHTVPRPQSRHPPLG
ncbi:MAG: hypothetical protein MZV64_29725 [Ignavibacteriales bacterium]|nr:hypothetical protein [Ignavibacteriales bacterium]